VSTTSDPCVEASALPVSGRYLLLALLLATKEDFRLLTGFSKRREQQVA
jgi:hypothetical protein